MDKLLSVLLFIPKIIFLGAYRCLCYGNEEQLLLLNCTEAIFILNVRCSKVAGAEDFAILIFFVYTMHYFSKLTRENLYLQSEKDSKFAKVLMSILHRQKRENMKAKEQAKDIKKQMKKIGNAPSGGSSRRPNNTFVINIGGKGKNTELPREEKHNIPDKSTPIILNDDEYKRIDDENESPYPILELGEGDYKKIDDDEGGNL